ncbi:hypothetical protein Efla_005260 [Eimeria flavescens]
MHLHLHRGVAPRTRRFESEFSISDLRCAPQVTPPSTMARPSLQSFRSTAALEAAYRRVPRAQRNPSEVDAHHNRVLLFWFSLLAIGTFWCVIICGYLSPYNGFHSVFSAIRKRTAPELDAYLAAHNGGWGLGVGVLADSSEARKLVALLWGCALLAGCVGAIGLEMAFQSAQLVSLNRFDSAWRLLHEPPPARPPASQTKREGDQEEEAEDGLAKAIIDRLAAERRSVHEEAVSLETASRDRQERELLNLGDVPWLYNGAMALDYDRRLSRELPACLRHRRPLKEGGSSGQQPAAHRGAFALRFGNSQRRRGEAQRRRLVKALRRHNMEEQLAASKLGLTIALQGQGWRSRLKRCLLRPFTTAARAVVRGARAFWMDCFAGGPLVTELSGASRAVRDLREEGAQAPAEWVALQSLRSRERTLAIQELLARHLLAEAVLEKLKQTHIHRHRPARMKTLHPLFPFNRPLWVTFAGFLYCLCWIPLGFSAALTTSLLGEFATFFACSPAAPRVVIPILGLHALFFLAFDVLLTCFHTWRARTVIRLLREELSTQLPQEQPAEPQQQQEEEQQQQQTSSSSSTTEASEQQFAAADGARCCCCDEDIHIGSFFVRPPVFSASVVNGVPNFKPTDGSPCCLHAMHASCYFKAPAPWCCTCAAAFLEGCRPWNVLLTPTLLSAGLACVSLGLRLAGIERCHRHPQREQKQQQQQQQQQQEGPDAEGQKERLMEMPPLRRSTEGSPQGTAQRQTEGEDPLLPGPWASSSSSRRPPPPVRLSS